MGFDRLVLDNRISKKQIVAIVEARMSSSRLPGKHLFQAAGRPMLQHLVDRLKRVNLITRIVIAMPKGAINDPLADLADELDVHCYRGSEENVMQRVLEAGNEYSADIICEVTGDCPIIDPELIEQLVNTFMANAVVYASNADHGLPEGMGAQVFYRSALARSFRMTNDLLDLEHVTLHMQRHPEIFPALNMLPPPSLYWPELGVTLDEKEDYILLKKLIEYFDAENPWFSIYDVIRTLRANPDWVGINKNVKRKGAT